jgi:hypothetical protein
LDREFELSCKHRFLVIWCYIIGFLQLSTILTRIFLTIYTRYWLNPKVDTNRIEVWACRLWITVVDWVTPFSLLYLYKHIGVSKKKEEDKPATKYNNNNNNHDITVGTERIKLLLEQDDNIQPRQPKTLSGPYVEVMVPTDYRYSSPTRSPMMTKP